MKHQHPLRHTQTGAAAVEFALIAIALFMLLFGVLEMGRVLLTWNAAAEATRYGARVAVVCDIDKTPPYSTVVGRMQRIMPNLPTNNVVVNYTPSNCTKDGSGGPPCLWVKVSIVNFSLQTHIPVVSTVLNMPTFSTTLPRESLESVNSAGETNPICT